MAKIATKEYIALSSCVSKHGLAPRGFSLIEYCEEEGFYGAAYEWLGTNEIVIAYRGTELTDIADILNDIAILFQLAVRQTKYAYSLYKHIKSKYPKATISLTGHSLGGALAQLVAVLVARDEGIGVHTETFNAPGVGDFASSSFYDFWKFGQFDVVNYFNPYDIIGSYGRHIGIEVRIEPEDLYRKKLNAAAWGNEDPVFYFIKITSEPGSHFLSFFEDYYDVDEKSFYKKEGDTERTTDYIAYDEVWPYGISVDTAPVFTMEGIIVFGKKVKEQYFRKQRAIPEKSWRSNPLGSRLEWQNNQFAFKEQWFYESYEKKFIGLSQDLNQITSDMYRQSDLFLLTMNKSIWGIPAEKQKEEPAVWQQSGGTGTTTDCSYQYVSRYDAKNFIPNSKGTAQQATINIINNLGVNLSAVSQTRWNGQQYVVEVALIEEEEKSTPNNMI